MKAVFIIGTDTGVGKSIMSGLLGWYLLNRGHRIITQKWVETGCQDFSNDINLHLELMGRKREDIKDYLSYVSLYTFKFASSPHLAARLERRVIRADNIKNSFKCLQKIFDFIIVEGVGGALVPFNNKKLLVDIAKELNLPVLIVVGNRLGAINHTLLAIEAIKARNMKIIGIIFNNLYKEYDKIILEDNINIIRNLTDEAILGVLPYMKDKRTMYKRFEPIGKIIFNQLIKVRI